MDRTSVADVRATLSVVGVGSIAGWQTASMPDDAVPTGSYIDANGKRVVTTGTATEGGEISLEKKLDLTEYALFQRMRGREGTVTYHVVDERGRNLSKLDSYLGVVKSKKPSDMDRAGADPLMITAAFEADGSVIRG